MNRVGTAPLGSGHTETFRPATEHGGYDGTDGFGVRVFFLACVVIAGVFGAFTAKRSILWAPSPGSACARGHRRPRARLAVAPVDSPSLLPDFHRLLAYHDWANGRSLEAVAVLPEVAWTRDFGSRFPSVQAAMAHAIVPEWVWLRRGQVAAMLRQLGYAPPPTDLLVFLREEAGRAAAPRP